MSRTLFKIVGIWVALLMLLSMTGPALAAPPYPEGHEKRPPVDQPVDLRLPVVERTTTRGKDLDQHNPKDYLRILERQRLLEAGQTAEANALAQTGTDRILVLLVEYAGTDTFTWTAGLSTWDPYGICDPNEDAGTAGDCSLIISQTTTFTYTGPLHNEMPRPVSAADRSGDSIWTEDFTKEWFEAFMFGNGVTFSYTRTDDSVVYDDFTGKSVTNYFEDASGGMYTATGDVYGWLQVPHSTWYYGADDCPGARSEGAGSNSAWAGAIPGAGNARTLRNHALDALNAISDTIPGFDWANYDLDNDGYIDRLWVVHAGYGEEESTVMLNRTDYGEGSMWSHSSGGSPYYEVVPGVTAGPYIMMPENGGIGVFAHESGHNLGADDLYSYDPRGETSAGFWTLMADDWTGYPIGFEPPAVDPWHLDNWGWLDPYVINSGDMNVHTVKIGQASNFPGDVDMYRGVKIELPGIANPHPVSIWQGSYYWWGGSVDLANAMMTTSGAIDLTGAATATLSFDMVYDVEDEWDFLWVQVSTDGITWDYTDTLTNANTQCIHDPGWVGTLNGFPDDLCGAGIGGYYGYNPSWPNPDTEVMDLSAYVGQNIYLRFWYMTDWGTRYTGVFIDNVSVDTDAGNVFFDDAESGDANWTYQDPWERSDGNEYISHNFYLQWRNVNDNGGYDEALGDERWRFGPANTGLLVWYNNNAYLNNEIWNYIFDDPSIGPKGRMLVVDSHPDPLRDPDLVAMGYDNEGGNLTSRGQMRNAPFTLSDTVDFFHTDPYRDGATQHYYASQPAMSSFHDALGYYPGAEYVRRGPAYSVTQFKWVTAQWDNGVTMPATGDYPTKAPGYDGRSTNPSANDREFRFECNPYLTGPLAGYLGCYWFGGGTGLGAVYGDGDPRAVGGTGNPGDYGLQYGWHVELIEEASDHTWAKVRIWNAMCDQADTLTPAWTSVDLGGPIQYTYDLDMNIGSALDNALVIVTFPATPTVEYVMNSATNGAIPLPTGIPAQQAAALFAEGGKAALEKLAVSQATDVGGIAWVYGALAAGEEGDSFSFRVLGTEAGDLDLSADVYDSATYCSSVDADTVTIGTMYGVYLPFVFKDY